MLPEPAPRALLPEKRHAVRPELGGLGLLGRCVQDVVPDLEGQADVRSIAGQGFELQEPGSGQEASRPDRADDQPPGLHQDEPPEGILVQIFGVQPDILVLPLDHPLDAGPEADLPDHGRPPGLGLGRERRLGHDLESQGQESVSRQKGNVLAEGLMARRPSAPQVIVIHGGQVVMDQGIIMD